MRYRSVSAMTADFVGQYDRETKSTIGKVHHFNNYTLCKRDRPNEDAILALCKAVARGTAYALDLSDDTSRLSTPKYRMEETCLNPRSHISNYTLVQTVLNVN